MSRRLAPLAAALCLAAGSSLAAVNGDGFETLDWKADLAQIMADPDWIGAPVETPYWSLDGKQLHYALKARGSSLREAWQISLAEPTPRQTDDAELAGLDAADPRFDRAGQRAAFIRDGDVFVRTVAGGRLQQLTRTVEAESAAQFSPEGDALLWRSGVRWYRHDFASALTAPLAELKAEKDPAASSEDALRDHQLRLSSTLARERADREARAARERALRALDPNRPAAPIYFGDEVTLSDAVLSPDARWMLVTTEAKAAAAGRAGKMPKYVTESGYEEVEDVRTRVGRNPPNGQALWLVELATQKITPIEVSALPGVKDDPLAELRKAAGKPALEGQRALRIDGLQWSADAARAAVLLRAIDNKDRWIATLQPGKPELKARHRLTDPGWINWSFNEFGWLPDGETLWYLSEESGYAHLYLRADRDGARAKAVTEGKWEASDVRWTRDGGRAYFLCNRQWPGDYEVCAVSRRGGAVGEVTALDGVEDFVLSPDESRLALRVSAHHTPPQLGVIGVDGRGYQALTDTRSAAYRERAHLAPQIVQIPSKQAGRPIWGKFYGPAQREPGKRYPIALFVHGAGYLQNVHARWPVYFREQMFNELLVKRGYVVLDLDYRASSGYGRDWRTAIYRQMGHPELEDYLAGIDWLVEQQQGDRERVGIYGGSYGGFMAFMALFRAPDAFHAGAALRPVTDWTSYNHEYTSNILNTPELDPEAFKKSSPIEYASNLRGQLLISHGMIDDNVFYQDSVRLAQRLIELRKDGWELASYPLERHAYVHPESWYDQYRRIYELFERTLKP